MKFTYQARTKEGKIQAGTIEASSREAASSLLQKYDFYVTSLKKVKTRTWQSKKFKFFKKVSKKELAIFSRQLAVMLESRVPVVHSLLSLAAQTTKTEFKEKIIKISELVEEGNSLSEAFSLYPRIFNIFYISLLKSGEASGRISESLYYLSDHLEREYDIMATVKGAMLYPVLVLLVLLSVIIIIIVGVIPSFTDILEEVGGDIPLMTRMMLSFYDFLKNFGWLLIISFVGLIIFLVYYLKTDEGKKTYDKMSLSVPLVGGFLQKFFLIRFAENISTLLSAGLSINRALRITKDIIGNFVYKRIISEAENEVSKGEQISSVLIKYPEVVPAFVTQMIKVGENTGKLDKTLMEIVNFYNKEIDRGVETFMSLLEPILIVFLGLVVGLLAVSVFMPLYGMLGAM